MLSDYLVVIDTETTGKTAGTHEMIQLSALVADVVNWKTVSSFSSLIQPRRWSLIDKEAMKVNQISIEDLKKAPFSETVRGQFLEWWSDLGLESVIYPAGWNYSFDRDFLKVMFGEAEYNSLFYYKAVEADTLAWAAQQKGIIPKAVHLSLAAVTEALDIPHLPHDAEGDTHATWRVIKQLVKGD